MLYLELLAQLLVQRLVVRDLRHQAGDLVAEGCSQFLFGGVRVLDGVVRQRGAEHHRIGHSALIGEHVGQGRWGG